MTNSDFDNTLASINFDRQITTNKANHLEVQKKINRQITKGYNLFLSRIYFTSDNGFQKCPFINHH